MLKNNELQLRVIHLIFSKSMPYFNYLIFNDNRHFYCFESVLFIDECPINRHFDHDDMLFSSDIIFKV